MNETLSPGASTVVLREPDGWTLYEKPRRVLTAESAVDVLPILREVEDAVESGRLHAAGFVAYEAAAGWGLPTRDPYPGLPLVWFGLYDAPRRLDAGHAAPGGDATWIERWQASVDAVTYAEKLGRIHQYLLAGDTYQVNFTFPFHAKFAGDPWRFFWRLQKLQRSAHAAYVDTGRHAVCCASPELFLDQDGERLTVRPMKGTARRGPTLVEDEQAAAALRASSKERAENLMIVDMVRNDLGRVAKIGTVAVDELFAVERYPTLLQMTSTIRAATDASFLDVIAATFPSASVTGAPKRRTMELIRDLEASPRGVYTGVIGRLHPGRRARFSVAIRTVVVDHEAGLARFGSGSGVVADSNAEDEYAECGLKAAILEEPPFQLLETMRCDPGGGYFLLERHLSRLAASAELFGVPLPLAEIRERLALVAKQAETPVRVRLLVDLEGVATIEVSALTDDGAPLRVALASAPTDDRTPWLYHKTTRRSVYARVAEARPGYDDVVLWNARGELMEATRANVVVELPEGKKTPAVRSGLLAGTFRAELLERGEIQEAVVRVEDLRRARRVFLINSVWRWREARLEDHPGGSW